VTTFVTLKLKTSAPIARLCDFIKSKTRSLHSTSICSASEGVGNAVILNKKKVSVALPSGWIIPQTTDSSCGRGHTVSTVSHASPCQSMAHSWLFTHPAADIEQHYHSVRVVPLVYWNSTSCLAPSWSPWTSDKHICPISSLMLRYVQPASC